MIPRAPVLSDFRKHLDPAELGEFLTLAAEAKGNIMPASRFVRYQALYDQVYWAVHKPLSWRQRQRLRKKDQA